MNRIYLYLMMILLLGNADAQISTEMNVIMEEQVYVQTLKQTLQNNYQQAIDRYRSHLDKRIRDNQDKPAVLKNLLKIRTAFNNSRDFNDFIIWLDQAADKTEKELLKYK